MVVSRAEALRKHFNKNEKIKKRYFEVMQGYIEKGNAELALSDSGKENGRKCFLTHFSVLNPKKKDKFRIVFDCAARHLGTSLDHALLYEPELVNCLVGVLTRF